MPPRTQWTEEGNALKQTEEYNAGEIMVKAGIHYLAMRSNESDYCLFPEHPEHIYDIFLHARVLVRKARPDVIVIEGFQLIVLFYV